MFLGQVNYVQKTMFVVETNETKLSYAEVKSLVRKHILEKWDNQYINYVGGSHYKFLFPNIHARCSFQSKTKFRLQTGHCILNHHLFRINCHVTGLCETCKKPENVPHYLLQCNKHSSSRKIFKDSVENLGIEFTLQNILTNKLVFPHLLLFIESSNQLL